VKKAGSDSRLFLFAGGPARVAHDDLHMTRLRWLASLLIAFHVAALVVAAVPAPAELGQRKANAARTAGAAGPLRSLFDRALAIVDTVQPAIFRALSPLRTLTRPYLAAGLDQRWQMFSRPYTADLFVRADVYVSGTANTTRVVRELVLPADPEGRVRLSYQPRDKAVLYALEHAVTTGADAAAHHAELQPYFEPIVRFIGNRIGRQLAPGERVVRTELWYGERPIPAPGSAPAGDAVAWTRLYADRP
jgi:hypothetical protein